MTEKMRKRSDQYKAAKEKFWAEEYPVKSFEEKVKYWSGTLHSQMRWNGESGFDEMAVFSKAGCERLYSSRAGIIRH